MLPASRLSCIIFPERQISFVLQTESSRISELGLVIYNSDSTVKNNWDFLILYWKQIKKHSQQSFFSNFEKNVVQRLTSVMNHPGSATNVNGETNFPLL